MASPNLDDIDRDAFDELERERDRQREPLRPGSRPPTTTPALPPGAARPAPFLPSRYLRARHAFQASVVDSVNHAFTDEPTHPGSDSLDIIATICPACARSVYASTRDGDRVDCWWCKTPLVTRALPDGSVTVERVEMTRGVP